MNPFSRIFILLVFSILAGALLPLHSNAAIDILVFDFKVSADFPDPWAGAALTDYAIRLLNESDIYHPMPREELRRMIKRRASDSGGLLTFEVQDTLRQHIGATAMIEGRLEYKHNDSAFISTLMKPDEGIIEDLSLTVKSYSFTSMRKLLKEKIEKIIGVKINDENITGTSLHDAYVSCWKGIHYYEIGDTTQAIPHLEKAAEIDKKYVEPQLFIGRILLEKADTNLAANHFMNTTILAPNDPRGHFWLGFTNYLLRRRAEAEASLLKALELNPNNPEYLYQLGVLYKSIFRYTDGVQMFKRAVEIDASIADAWYQLAAIHSIMKMQNETLVFLKNAVMWGRHKMVVKLENDADFDWIRGSPKFISILKSGHK